MSDPKQTPAPPDAALDPNAAPPEAAVSATSDAAPPPAAEPFHKVLWKAWREATDGETPTLNQLIQQGVKRVDVDAVAGYLAVVMEDDTHRAIGVRRELVAPLVAAFTGRTAPEVEALLAKGPAKIEPRAATPADETG